MAKAKSSNSRRNADDISPTPTSLTSLLSPPLPAVPLEDPVIIKQLMHSWPEAPHDPISDRRRFHPERHFRPAYALIPGAARLGIGRNIAKVSFITPKAVAICLRRKVRREVYFALGLKKKKGKGGGKPRRRNHYSSVSC